MSEGMSIFIAISYVAVCIVAISTIRAIHRIRDDVAHMREIQRRMYVEKRP